MSQTCLIKKQLGGCSVAGNVNIKALVEERIWFANLCPAQFWQDP